MRALAPRTGDHEGAGGFAVWRHVALPLRWPGVAAGAGIALALAAGELSATLLVAPPGVTTVPMRVFQLLHYGVDDRVAALALSVFGLLGLVLLATATLRAAWRRRPVRAPLPVGPLESRESER